MLDSERKLYSFRKGIYIYIYIYTYLAKKEELERSNQDNANVERRGFELGDPKFEPEKKGEISFRELTAKSMSPQKIHNNKTGEEPNNKSKCSLSKCFSKRKAIIKPLDNTPNPGKISVNSNNLLVPSPEPGKKLVKKKGAFFGMGDEEKKAKVVQLWKNAFRKVTLINRVFFQMKTLTKDIKMLGASNTPGAQKMDQIAIKQGLKGDKQCVNIYTLYIIIIDIIT